MVVAEAVDVVVVAEAVDVAAVAAEAAAAVVAAVAAAGAAVVSEAVAYRGASAVFVESMQFFAHRQKKEGAVGRVRQTTPANCLRHSPFATCPRHRSATRKQTYSIYLCFDALGVARLKQPKTSRRTFWVDG
jgi:hypothetical protein